MNRNSTQQHILDGMANMLATIHLGQSPDKVDEHLARMETTLATYRSMLQDGRDLTGVMAELTFAEKVWEAALEYVEATTEED